MLNIATSYFSQFGYIVVALAMLAEGLTLPCPAVAILLMAGAAVAHGRMSFWLVVSIAAVSYSLGSYIPYILGRHVMKFRTDTFAGRLVARSATHLEKLGKLFTRYGEQSVALARPFWIGNYVSYFAGISHMPLLRFFVLTFGGIMAWSVVVVSVGEAFSANLPRAALLIKQYSVAAAVGLVVVILLYALISRQLRKALLAKAFL